MSWKGESRRHSLARRGIKTINDKDRSLIFSNFYSRGIRNPLYITAIKQHLKGLSDYELNEFLSDKKLRLLNVLSDTYWKETGSYPDKNKRDDFWKEINELSINDLIENGSIQAYIVKPHERVRLTFGSDTQLPLGTHTKSIAQGNIIVYDGRASDGTTWFIYEGERAKSISFPSEIKKLGVD